MVKSGGEGQAAGGAVKSLVNIQTRLTGAVLEEISIANAGITLCGRRTSITRYETALANLATVQIVS